MTQDLQITDISRSGPGVARDSEGRVIFVPYTAPGELARVRIIESKRPDKRESKKRYAQGELLEILTPSGVRQKPRCPVFSRCGGCQWQHLPYELQWKTKKSGLEHALSRVNVKVGRTIEPDSRTSVQIEDLPAEVIWEYRNRVQLRGEFTGERVILGFYGPKSHDVIPIERCDIARAEINDSLPATREEAKKLNRPFKVEIEVAEDGAVHKSWNQGHAAMGFRQVHDAQNEKLRSWVLSAITPGLPLLDLFGGSGNLSLQFIGKSPEIHCVDLSVPRVRPSHCPESFHFHRSSVVNWVKAFQEKGGAQGKKWSAVLDPPREGLGSDFTPILEALEKIGVVELLLVGCDVDAWARDFSRILKRGWKFKRIAALDLFPQTPHVESLALFGL